MGSYAGSGAYLAFLLVEVVIYLDEQDPDEWCKKHDLQNVYGQCSGCGQIRHHRRPWISKDFAGIDFFCDNEGTTCNHKSASMTTISEEKCREWAEILDGLKNDP